MRALALLLLLSLAACSGDKAPVPATAHANASTSTTVGGVTLQTSTVALADLNDAVAARYGIERSGEGVMLLVTVRDGGGNGIDPGDLQLTTTASVLPDPPKALALRQLVEQPHPDGARTEEQGERPALEAKALVFVARGALPLAQQEHPEVAAREQRRSRERAQRPAEHDHVEIAGRHPGS